MTKHKDIRRSTALEKAQSYVRRCLLNEKDPDLSTLPESIRKSSSQIQSNFRCNVRKIYQPIRESDRIEVFVVDKNIGLGIRAKRVIYPETVLSELTALGGKRLLHSKSAKHPSAVQTSKGINKVYDHVLHGTLAFVNHACVNHANIHTCKPNNKKSDWRFAKTKDSIKKGEEITAFYSPNAFTCRLCDVNK